MLEPVVLGNGNVNMFGSGNTLLSDETPGNDAQVTSEDNSADNSRISTFPCKVLGGSDKSTSRPIDN